MRKFLLGLALIFVCTTTSAQDFWGNHGRGWNNNGNMNNNNFYRPPVGYYPRVQWYPDGVWMNVGPVVVSPDRRYIRFGIDAGFSQYRGFSTFNFYNGQTRYYGR